MKLKDIKVVGAPLALASTAEVSEMEAALDTPFPPGYREFMTTLGDGVLGASSVRVYWAVCNRPGSGRQLAQAEKPGE